MHAIFEFAQFLNGFGEILVVNSVQNLQFMGKIRFNGTMESDVTEPY